jgi:hypothetical protein
MIPMSNVTLLQSPCGVTARSAGKPADARTFRRANKTMLPARHLIQDPHAEPLACVASNGGLLAIDTTSRRCEAGRNAHGRHRPDPIAMQQQMPVTGSLTTARRVDLSVIAVNGRCTSTLHRARSDT